VASTPDYVKSSRAEGRKLSKALSDGWRPSGQNVPIQLRPGENCYGQGKTRVWQFLEGDGSYLHKTRFGFSAVGVAMAAGTVVGNTARKARAAREAAPRFRQVDEGPFYLTDMRFAIQGKMQWTDLWYNEIRMIDCDSASITINASGIPPIKIDAWPADYFYVLYHFLVNDKIIQVPPDYRD
jgi:hypothetical protein